jgi:hypothetical protein
MFSFPNHIIILYLVFFIAHSFGSEKEVSIKLNNNIILYLYASELRENITNDNDTLKNELTLINTKQVFGTDYELPQTVLDSAKVQLYDQIINLDVSCMYNPWFGNINFNNFKHKWDNDYLYINGLFSDGAGGYITQWRIYNDNSIRTIISNDESIIFLFFE